MQLSEREYDILNQTLTGRTGRVYRNRYVCGPGQVGYELCDAMFRRGLMEVRLLPLVSSAIFFASCKGIAAFRAHKRALSRSKGGA